MSSADASWFHFWEGLATFGFVLVILGCVIEGVEHFWKFKKGETRKKHFIEKIGWFILIGGLAIEFLGENRAKRIADRENARLTKEAGDARKEAAEARRTAATTESNNLALRTNLISLARAFDLSTNALAEARARIAELRYLQNPRLPGGAHPLYFQGLPHERMKVSVTYEDDDTHEPKYVAEMIHRELDRKWERTRGPLPMREVSYKEPGIMVFIRLPVVDPVAPPNNRMPNGDNWLFWGPPTRTAVMQTGNMITRTLKSSGMEARELLSTNVNEGSIEVHVGPKMIIDWARHRVLR